MTVALTPFVGVSLPGPPPQGGKFTVGGEKFVFAGWNQWEVLEVGLAAYHHGSCTRHMLGGSRGDCVL